MQRPKGWPRPASDGRCVWRQGLAKPARAPHAKFPTECIDTSVTGGYDAERAKDSTFGGGWVFFLQCQHYLLPFQSSGACTGASARKSFPRYSSPPALHRIRVLDHRVFGGCQRVSYGREFRERCTSLMWRHAIQMGDEDFTTTGSRCLLRQTPGMKLMAIHQKLMMVVVMEDASITHNAPSSHQHFAIAWQMPLLSLRRRS